ncbi:MAG: MFS transporter [Bowdeniella nasicola]|nr:MFS transporter [Bowdeniella nasicola]
MVERAQLNLVFVAIFLAWLGQMILNPIIAPLARELGLQEWHIGATISLAALTLAALSQYWGRRSLRVGAKKVLVTSMAIAALALLFFAIIAGAGMQRRLSPATIVWGVILTRGVLYGGAIAAIAPTVQAYITSAVPGEQQRLKLLGAVGAVQGLSVMVGAVIGGGLAIAGLMVPLIVMPVMVGIGMVVVLVRMRPYRSSELVAEPPRISFFDPRVFPFLVIGFMLFLSFSSLGTLVGFAVQDRFGLDSSATAAMTAVFTLAMSLFMVLTQSVAVPKLGWHARKLLRVGLALMALAMGLLILPSSYPLFALACVLTGIGFGLALPGYTTGPTLAASAEEQGGIAGVVNANNGLTYAIAPILSTSLYGWAPLSPFIMSAVLLLVSVVFTSIHPTLRRGSTPVSS